MKKNTKQKTLNKIKANKPSNNIKLEDINEQISLTGRSICSMTELLRNITDIIKKQIKFTEEIKNKFIRINELILDNKTEILSNISTYQKDILYALLENKKYMIETLNNKVKDIEFIEYFTSVIIDNEIINVENIIRINTIIKLSRFINSQNEIHYKLIYFKDKEIIEETINRESYLKIGYFLTKNEILNKVSKNEMV